MSKFDIEYLKLCRKILKEGVITSNRTGVDAIKIPHYVMQFNLSEEFPILTTKYIAFKSLVFEILWIFQQQSNDVKWLNERGVKIWDEWVVDSSGNYQNRLYGKEYTGTIGTAYGYVLKKYNKVDELIGKLKTDPYDRGNVISLWQDAEIKTGTLRPCVWSSEWDVTNGYLNCMVHQRSCDVPLGLPFNITQYAVLVNLIAQVTNLKPGMLTWTINNAHIYVNQVDGIKEQLKRAKLAYPAPTLVINKDIKDFYQFDSSKELKDIKLENYQSHQKIKMPIAV